MNYGTLLFDVRDGIALITINRPDKLNALNDQVMAELADVAQRLATDDAIRGAILTGAGPKAFVAGADIGDLAKQGPFDGKARARCGSRWKPWTRGSRCRSTRACCSRRTTSACSPRRAT